MLGLGGVEECFQLTSVDPRSRTLKHEARRGSSVADGLNGVELRRARTIVTKVNE